MARSKPQQHYGKWRIRWTDAEGKRHSEVYETQKDANFALSRHENEVEEIKRGLLIPIAPNKTFADIAEYWLSNRCPAKGSGASDKSIISNHLLPYFGTMPLTRIGVVQVDAYKAKKTESSVKTLFNHLTLLISMLNLAADLNWLSKVPKIKKPKISSLSQNFRYLKNEEEIDRFLKSAQIEGEDAYALYIAAIYTGARQGELAGLKKADVDIERRLITIHKSFAGPTKSRKVRYVPILDPILPIIIQQLRRPGSDYLFPNNAGTMLKKSSRIFQEKIHRVLDRAGFPKTKYLRKGKPSIKRYITFHDLRHTFASLWVSKGLDIFRLQKILGHQSIQMTMRYAHLAPDIFVKDYACLGSGQNQTNGEVVQITGRISPAIDVKGVAGDSRS